MAELGDIKWARLSDKPSSWKKWEAKNSINNGGGSSSRHFQ